MNQLLMFWNLQKAAVKTFARVALEISMVLESARGCCESCNTASSLFYIYKTAVIIEIMVAAVGVMDWFYL